MDALHPRLLVQDFDSAARFWTAALHTIASEPQDRPDWGPGLRTAHLRTPDGTLLELQSH